MAGFLDKVTEFNPYVSQVPVEDYLRVGMQKQAMYDMGVQKVQSHIDTVAGLEVAKGIHKEYLNSALGKLQNQVKKVTASDFSNSQLVNQIGGLANQISNDPILKQAVASTMFAKKNMDQIEKERADGKLNPANEYDFYSKYQSWLNDGKLDTSFNSNYTPYRDVTKKLVEGFKSITGNSSITDLPFRMDGAGNILRDENGDPVLNEVSIRQQYKGISAKRIQDMMKAVLDEGDLEQLRISGKYQYKDITPEIMESQIRNSFANSLRDLNEAKETLLAKKIGAKTSDQDQIQSSIEAIDSEIGKLQSQASNIDNSVQSMYADPEGYKANKFVNDYFKNFTSAYAYTEASATYIPNEYMDYRMKRETMDLAYNKFAYDQSRDLVEDQKWKMDYDLKAKEASEKEKKEKGLGATNVFEGRLSTDVEESYSKLNTEIKTQENQLAELNRSVLNSTPELQKVSQGVQAKALEMLYSDYLSNGEITKDPFLNSYLEKRQQLEYDLAINKNLAVQASEIGMEAAKSAKPTETKFSNNPYPGFQSAPGYVPVLRSESLSEAKIRVNLEKASEFINERTNKFLPQYSAIDTDDASKKLWSSQVLAKINSGVVGANADEIRKLVADNKAKFTLRDDQSTGKSEIIVTDDKGKVFPGIPLSNIEARALGFGKFSPAIVVKNIIYSNRKNNAKIGTTNISGDALGAGFNHKHMPHLKNPDFKNIVRADVEGSDEEGGYVPKVWIKNPKSTNNNKWILKNLSDFPIPLEDALLRIQMINDNAIEAELNK